jgi:hypothetical protein
MPQIWGKILHGVHKRLPVLGLVFEVLKWLFTDLGQGFQVYGWPAPNLEHIILIF